MPADDRLKALGDFIRNQRRLAHLSLREMADRARVSNPYLSQIERGLYHPSAEVLKKIAKALGLPGETLFSQAGLIDGDGRAVVGIEEAIRLDAELTTDQKDALIGVYKSFTTKA